MMISTLVWDVTLDFTLKIIHVSPTLSNKSLTAIVTPQILNARNVSKDFTSAVLQNANRSFPFQNVISTLELQILLCVPNAKKDFSFLKMDARHA